MRSTGSFILALCLGLRRLPSASFGFSESNRMVSRDKELRDACANRARDYFDSHVLRCKRLLTFPGAHKNRDSSCVAYGRRKQCNCNVTYLICYIIEWEIIILMLYVTVTLCLLGRNNSPELNNTEIIFTI